MDFELLAVGLRALLALLSDDFRAVRARWLREAEEQWNDCSVDEQTEWLRRMENMRQALLSMHFKKETKLLEAIDALFQRPCCHGRACQLITLGHAMSVADKSWRAVGLRNKPTDLELAAEMTKKFAVNDLSYLYILHNYRWAEAGFPTVKVSPKFAAASMCTKALPEVLDDLKPPWRGFVIEMPREEVLYQFNSEGKPMPVALILVLWADNYNSETNADGNWSVILVSESDGLCTHRTRSRSRNLCEIYSEADDPVPWVTMENKDDQSLMLAGRVVVSTICALTNPETVVHSNSEVHRRWNQHPSRRLCDEPEARIFQITAPVNLDLVDFVRDYQLDTKGGKTWKLTTQRMVCGHHKMQPFGKGHSQRKKIWIQPYWKGPSDAPIAVRPHKL